MDKKLKMKWVRALESGKFKQGYRRLRKWHADGVYQCCLDILRTVADDKRCARGSKELSSDQLKDYGMTVEQQNRLIALNDDEREPFNQIAKWIRAHL
jgi:hypothetical protein